MQGKFWLILVLVTAGAAMSGCVPLMAGAGGAVLGDQIMEQENGGDGLF